MKQKARKPVMASNGRQFPPEAYKYDDDVSAETVTRIRETRGVDVSLPKWKVIEALGQIVHT